MSKMLKRFIREEDGQGMAEYGLILALVAVVVIGLLGTMGTTIKEKFQDVIDGLNGVTEAPSEG